MSDDTFIIYHGSALSQVFNWPNGAGGNANLTGFTVAFHDAHPDIISRATVTITNAATGAISVSLPWVGPHMTRGKWLYFSIRIISGAGVPSTTNRLWVEIQ